MENLRNIKLTLEYEGTNYFGFQKQPEAPTVQGELEKALKKIIQQETKISAAGRTDAGVHATGQAVSFLTASAIPAKKIPVALNGVLPADILVKEAVEVGKNFHARLSARKKEYAYWLWVGKYLPVGLRNYMHFVPQPLDVGLMRQVGRLFVGRHNFSQFCLAEEGQNNFYREIYSLEVEKKGKPAEQIAIKVVANGFLRRMVRFITGALIEVGSKSRNIEEIRKLISINGSAPPPGAKKSLVAPPQGLWLTRVTY